MGKKSQRVGDQLQNMIDATNDGYLIRGLCFIHRQHEEVKTNKHFDPKLKKNVITNAYYKSKGALDYAGVVAGQYVTFDAKSAADRLPFANIEEHQIKYMDYAEKFGGHAFIIAYIRNVNAIYLVPAYYIVPLWREWNEHKKQDERSGTKTRYEGGASLNVTNLNENAFVVMPSMLGAVDWLPAFKKMVQAKMDRSGN